MFAPPYCSHRIIILTLCVLSIVLPSDINLNISIFRENNYVLEAFIFLLLIVLAVFQIFKSLSFTQLTFFEFFSLIFIFYTLLKNILFQVYDINSLAHVLFIAIVYYGLKSFFASYKLSELIIVLFYSTGFLLLSYIIIVIYNGFSSDDAIQSLFHPNKSIFSILLAGQLVFILPIFFYYRKQTHGSSLIITHFVFTIVIVACMFLLAKTNGRAGWLGFLLGLFYMVCQYILNVSLKRIIPLYGGFFLFCFSSLVFPIRLIPLREGY